MSLQFVHSHDAQQAHTAAIWAIAVTPTDHVLSASLDGTIALDASSSSSSFSANSTVPGLVPGARIRTWPPHPLGWTSLSVAAHRADGENKAVEHLALVNSIAGTTMLVNYTTGETLGKKGIGQRDKGPGTVDGYAEPAWSVSLAASGQVYASTGGSGSVTIHSTAFAGSSKMEEGESTEFGSRLADISTGRSKFGLFVDHCPSDDCKIAMSNESGQLFILDVEKEVTVTSWASHAMPVRSFAWSDDGNLLMSASDDKRLVLHDARIASQFSTAGHLTGHSQPILSVALSPGDGKLALSGGRDGTVRVWDVGMRKAVAVVREGPSIYGVAWRPMAFAVKPDVKEESMSLGAGGIGGSGAAGFVTGGEDGIVRWYRGAGVA
ncbi:WD40 repeat-like protein [Serendipita vermifera]|nr:WD40 repeat-like protein [Serendipita vermifera]